LWGHHEARLCRRRLRDYVDLTRQWAHKTGQKVEFRAQRTADDIKAAVARFDLERLARRRQQP
jgi:hypothetical protein